MFSRQKKSRGIAITLSLILEGLFIIALIGFLYWFFLSRILEIHVAIEEFTTERQAINLANLLISSEKIAYEDNGIIKGVLDAEKLDSVFIKKTDFLSEFQAIFQPKDIGIGYPNTINMVRVIDLEKCDSSGYCDGWVVVLSSPITLEGLPMTKLFSCLAENVKLDLGFLFRYYISGPIGLWQPWDFKKCVQNTIPSRIKSVFTKSEVVSSGFPVIIRYPNGELHIGRISVGVGEFI